MLRLISYELKKIFTSKWILLYLLIVVFLLPLILPYTSDYGTPYCLVDDNGKTVSKEEYRKLHSEMMNQYKGDLYDPNYRKMIAEKLEETKTLIEDGQSNEKEMGETCEGRKYSLTYYVLMNINSDIENYQGGSISYIGNGLSDPNQTEKDHYLEAKLKKTGIIIGDDTGYRLFFNTIGATSILLAGFFLFISPSIFNKEDKDKTIALLKTTKEGKRKIALAKITTLVLLATVIPIIHYLWSSLVSSQMYPFHPELTNFYNINMNGYTFGEQYLWGLVGFPIAYLAIAGVGMVCSSWIRSSYLTLGILTVFLVGPLFIPNIGAFNLKLFLPNQFMSVNSIGFFDLFYVDGRVVSAMPFIIILWSILLPLLILLTYYGYKRHQVTND